ncbi:MAG: insulinase family protein [Myxococcales bacterium]|nr:insulinase family protein [Myxococcales bacterium]
MRRLAPLALAGIFALSGISGVAALPSTASAAADLSIPIEKFTLENGLTVVLSEDHSAPIVSVYITYKVGSAQEVEGRTGFAHLFEHMMFNGSKNIPEGAFGYYVDNTGGSLNGNTEPDRTNYFETVPSNYLEGMLYLEASRMDSLILTEESLGNEKDVVKEEVRQQQENQPFAKTILLDWPAAAFSSWAYNHSIYGSMEDLTNAPAQAFIDFFDRFYTPNNAVLSICGDIDPAKTKALVEKYFGPLKKGPELQHSFPEEAAQTAAVYTEVKDPLAPVPLSLVSFDIPPPREKDRDALELLATILTDGASARLPKRLVDDEKLAATVMMQAGFPIPTYGPGQLATLLVASKDTKLADLRAAYWDELEKVKKKGISAAELKRAKAKLYKLYVEGLSKTLYKAAQLATYESFYGGAEKLNGDYKRFDKITAGDLKRVANTYLTQERSVTFDIVPGADAPGIPGGAE